MKTVGILGGGQLGLMLAHSLQILGAEVVVFDPDPEAPAMRCVRNSVIAKWDDTAAMERFFQAVDVVTYEFESVPAHVLRAFEKRKPIVPSPEILHRTRDRALEKEFLASADLPRVKFVEATDLASLMIATKEVGFPCVIKTTQGGYDGKGQAKVKAANQVKKAFESLGRPNAVVVEELIDLVAEASCIVARTAAGQEVVFPVFENIHRDHILDITVLPARLPKRVAQAIQSVALRAARALEVEGLLTTEFFIAKKAGRGGRMQREGAYYIAINEFAPRPHNSGHLTRNACTVSQYDALARVLLGVPLQEPRILTKGTYCMGNLLGDVWIAQGRERHLDLEPLSWTPEVIDVVLYGKTEARSRRKMGHFVVYAENSDEAVDAARRFRESLQAQA